MLRPGLSFPFSIPRERANAPEATGVVTSGDDALVIEYVIARTVVANKEERTPVRQARLALADIAAAEVDRGWFSTVLRLRVRSLAAIAELPGGTSGELALHLRRRDRMLADELVSGLALRLAQRDLDALRDDLERR